MAEVIFYLLLGASIGIVSWLVIIIMADIGLSRKSRRIQRGIAEYFHRKREGKESLGQGNHL